MRDRGELLNVLQLPNSSWTGVLYRIASLNALHGFHQRLPAFPDLPILHGYGSPQYGARYTPVGGPRCIYLGEDPETALQEAILSGEPVDPGRFPPKVVCAVTGELTSVLDVTQKEIQASLGTTREELTAGWRMLQRLGQRVPTQLLGAAVFETGRYQAIRFPSARAQGKACYVVFNDRVIPPSYLEIYDPERRLLDRIP
jgi:RES domain-containing protein